MLKKIFEIEKQIYDIDGCTRINFRCKFYLCECIEFKCGCKMNLVLDGLNLILNVNFIHLNELMVSFDIIDQLGLYLILAVNCKHFIHLDLLYCKKTSATVRKEKIK